MENRTKITQKEKELLLRDLSARLPYGVICQRLKNAYELVDIDIKRGVVYLLRDETYVPYSISAGDEIKPYLRPMSSMTEEEKETYKMFFNEDGLINTSVDTYLDWLLENHFDYRGLIPMGLAIEVIEGNNPYKK